jgi:hypothetical protein
VDKVLPPPLTCAVACRQKAVGKASEGCISR